LSVDLLENALCGQKAGMVRRDAIRHGRVPIAADGQRHAGGYVRFEMPRDELADRVGALVGNEAAAELRVRLVRRDRLAARALVAAPHAVHLERRTYPLPFQGGDRKSVV